MNSNDTNSASYTMERIVRFVFVAWVWTVFFGFLLHVLMPDDVDVPDEALSAIEFAGFSISPYAIINGGVLVLALHLAMSDFRQQRRRANREAKRG